MKEQRDFQRKEEKAIKARQLLSTLSFLNENKMRKAEFLKIAGNWPLGSAVHDPGANITTIPSWLFRRHKS